MTKIEVTGKGDVPSSAFANCTNIEDILIDGGTRIFDGVFSNCKNLKHLYIPASVTQIGDKILEGCDQIETLTVPFIGRNENDTGTETSVLGGFFGWDDEGKRGREQYYDDARKLSHFYKIPDTLKNISVLRQANVPTGALERCVFIEKVSIATGRTLGAYAFSNCTALKEVSLPENMEEIGKEAFSNCSAFSSVTFKLVTNS